MQKILIIIKKEFIELKYSFKSMLFLVCLLALFTYTASDGTGTVFLKAENIVSFLLLGSALGAMGQFISESIMSEKKSKMLEVLLSTKIPYTSLIISKVVPGFIIGNIVVLITLFIFSFIETITIPLITVISVLNFLLYTFLAGVIFFTITIFLPDEKIVSFIAIFQLALAFGVVKLLMVLGLSFYSLITAPLLCTISIIMILIAKFILQKNKLFLKI